MLTGDEWGGIELTVVKKTAVISYIILSHIFLRDLLCVSLKLMAIGSVDCDVDQLVC